MDLELIYDIANEVDKETFFKIFNKTKTKEPNSQIVKVYWIY